MSTPQPVWEFLANLGDASPVDYGGFFVYRDTTGVHGFEAELLQEPCDEGGYHDCDDHEGEDCPLRWTVYRVRLDRCTFIDGVLSDNRFHPEHAAWFAKDLESVARTMGTTADEIRADLCSDDGMRRAHAYRSIYDYHGWANGDSYPLTLTRAEVEARYDEES